MEHRKKKISVSSRVIFVCLTAARYRMVRWSRPIQWSIHFLYIHQPTHHLYLFILCGPGWLECLHSSKWEKRKVSFLYTVYFAKNILAFPPPRHIHQLAFFELAEEKCSNCFVSRSLKMYGRSEAFLASLLCYRFDLTNAPIRKTQSVLITVCWATKHQLTFLQIRRAGRLSTKTKLGKCLPHAGQWL